MNEIALAGCTPTPLASYLKALGVLRLLSGAFPNVRATWQREHLVIISALDRAALEEFFLRDYRPTPIMAPWNGGSGFFEKDSKTALETIRGSTSPRLTQYRECLRLVDQVLGPLDRSASPKAAAKTALLLKLRGVLPDAVLDWFDASVLLSGDFAQYPPMLGTGGNDGRLDFTNNFMQRLAEVLSPNDDAPSMESVNLLRVALYRDTALGLVRKAIGQFSPGQVGGPNATTGFEAESVINPWDFVLMIEGTLSFAAAVVRRNADDPAGTLSYPFTVRAVGAGAGNLGEGDATSSRGELWMPLWRQPATYSEVRALLAEGRVALDRKPALDALDFVRAVHRLGGYRGVDSFQRYGLLMRSGKAYLATPLTRVQVADDPKTDWLDDLDQHGWLTRFRRFAQGPNVARRFLAQRRQLESTLFDLASRAPAPGEAQALLTLLSDIQTALGASRKAREFVLPLPRLSERWVKAADDGTTAFRIARAVAGMTGTSEVPLPLRAQLFPVHPAFNRWMDDAHKTRSGADDPFCRLRVHTRWKSHLPDILIALLSRRLWLAERLELADKPLRSPAGIDLDDLLAFLQSDRMDRHVAVMLSGLSLCRIPPDIEHAAGEGVAPAAFALLKIIVTPDAVLHSVGVMKRGDRLPMPTSLLAQLVAGNIRNRAVRLAWRRARISGLAPRFASNAVPELGNLDPRRAAAALLIPLRFGATRTLALEVLESQEVEMA